LTYNYSQVSLCLQFILFSPEAVEHVTDENWKKCNEHSKKIENEMRRIGENFGTVPELIISLQDSSSDTSTESDNDKENFD
jgi:hypothetical protein